VKASVLARVGLPAGFCVAFVCLLLVCRPAYAHSDITKILPFEGAQLWLNSAPLTPAALKGDVVLVDFWDYTCVNCLRTLPYEKAWYERYKDQGFTIVGVHTPEFAFAGESDNVRAALKRLGITWPVVLDSDNLIWNRYHNDSWPHEFLFDADGRLVSDHVGEGDYPQTEATIQRLIHAMHPKAVLPPKMTLLPQDNYTKPGAVCYPQTREMYLGYWRGSEAALGNREGYQREQIVRYGDPLHHHLDGFVYLEGSWFDSAQAVVHAGSSDKDYATFRYHAIEVVAVLKPEAGKPMIVYIQQDGKPVTPQDAGSDVRYDEHGASYLLVDVARAYEVVMNKHFGHHDLRLTPQTYGLGLYSFAFESCEVGTDR